MANDMIKDKKVLAIIPARGSHDEVPYLNIKKLGNKPLIAHTIDSALESRFIDRIIVSTDDEEVATISKEYGAEVPFMRPESLGRDIPTLNPIIIHAVDYLETKEDYFADIIVLLQTTTPFRGRELIDEAITKLIDEDYDSVISMVEEKWLNWEIKNGKLKPLFKSHGSRSEASPIYRENGAINVFYRKVLTKESRLGNKIGYILMDKYSSFTVYSIADFWAAEKLMNVPRILFRVDGSQKLGMGHIYRCIAIASELKKMVSSEIQFLMNADHKEGIFHVSEHGYHVKIINNGSLKPYLDFIREYSPNIIINDFPFTESSYMKALSKIGAPTINLVDSLDDLENPQEFSNTIINMLYEESISFKDYYTGPVYAILRESFKGRRKVVRKSCKSILLTFGGSDPQGLTIKAVKTLDSLPQPLKFDVVLGPAFAYRKELNIILSRTKHKFKVHHKVKNIAELMVRSDLIICSGGMTLYEIAAIGSVGIVLCQNMRELKRVEQFSKYETIINLGLGVSVANKKFLKTVTELIENYKLRKEMSKKGLDLVDGMGANRISQLIVETQSKLL